MTLYTGFWFGVGFWGAALLITFLGLLLLHLAEWASFWRASREVECGVDGEDL